MMSIKQHMSLMRRGASFAGIAAPHLWEPAEFLLATMSVADKVLVRHKFTQATKVTDFRGQFTADSCRAFAAAIKR